MNRQLPISPPLAVEGISKGFPGVQALRDVSFDCRVGEIHALLGETVHLTRPVRELSVAERQIVEIARALSVDAPVLILDEPTSSLTPKEVRALCSILRDLRARGTSIVFISHRLPEIFAIADRI